MPLLRSLASVLDFSSAPPIIVVQTDAASPSSPFSLRSFIGSSLFSYAAATLMMAVALLVAWGWRRPAMWTSLGTRRGRRRRTSGQSRRRRWSAESPAWPIANGAIPRQKPSNREGVGLGRKYALASGFLEITYDSGAKVILQGPGTYEVESMSGGFLSLGKLTALVEAKNDECRMINDEFHAQECRKSSFIIHHSSFRLRVEGRANRQPSPLRHQRSGRGRNQPLRSPLAPRPANPKSEIRNPKFLIPNP